MAAHLELVRGALEAPALSEEFGTEICDEICAAVDDAVTLEDALRGILRTICRRMRWAAGRATHRDSLPVWHVDGFHMIPHLRRALGEAQPGAIEWHQPWTLGHQAGLSTIVLPIEWAANARLEFWSTLPFGGFESTLDDLARALAPAGALLRRKRGERAQRASVDRDRKLFFLSPVPSLVVAAADGRIHLANHAALATFGYSAAELKALRFDELLVSPPGHALPAPGTATLLRQRRKDGRELIVEVRTQPHELDDGTPAAIVSAHDVTDRLLAQQQLEAAAATDALTGLHNRVSFERHLALALERAREGALFAVLFLDLDGFKGVNDTLGHAAGDALLCEVARRLKGQLRTGDLAARLGGDEFTVLLPLRALAEAVPVAERVQHALLQPFRFGDHEVLPSASIGVAFAGPLSAAAETVLRDADVAMYRAKAKGRGNVVFATNLRDSGLP